MTAAGAAPQEPGLRSAVLTDGAAATGALAAARRGTGLLAAAGAGSGLLNYGFIVLISALLAPADFVVVAAGQGLLLVVGSAAAATVPWLIAQRLATSGASPSDRASIARSGAVTALVVAAVSCVAVVASSPFGQPAERAALGGAAFLICVGQVGTGWAQGTERYRLLALMVLGEVALKVVLGAAAAASGLGAVGVFLAAASGGLFLTAAAVILLARDLERGQGQRRRAAVAGWWRAVGTVATARTAVAALGVVDVVLVASLLDASPTAAAYQLAMSVGRIPLFLATAVGQAWLGVLARSPGEPGPVEETWRRLLVLAIPAAAAVATMPAFVAGRVLGASPDLVQFLPPAAVVGLAIGVVSLATTWGQVRDRRLWVGSLVVLGLLHAGAVGLVARSDDLEAVAWTTAGSIAVVSVILVLQTAPARWRAWPPLWPLVGLALMALARPWPVVWLVATGVVGLLTVRQLAGGGRRR